MRRVLFVVFFTTGVSLMVISGFVPQRAQADSEPVARQDAEAQRPVQPYAHHREIIRPTRTRRIPAPIPNDGDFMDPPVDAAWTQPPADEIAQPEHEPKLPAENAAAAAYVDSSPSEPGPTVRPADEVTGADDFFDVDDDGNAAGPRADAGPDGIAWVGWDELPLNGAASTRDGVTYAWKQVDGPTSLTIKDVAAVRTAATGLPLGGEMSWDAQLYTFELAVTDEAGQSSRDAVSYVVLSAPELAITPKAERRFEQRDGYWVAVFEAWVTNTETYESAFRIEAPVALSLTRIGGEGEYDLSTEEKDGVTSYYVVLFGAEDVSATWVELLINTEENIPGVLQLGVSWDGLARRSTKGSKPSAEDRGS
jgi:hypothetical protein